MMHSCVRHFNVAAGKGGATTPVTVVVVLVLRFLAHGIVRNISTGINLCWSGSCGGTA